jgi:malate dehydrogenase
VRSPAAADDVKVAVVGNPANTNALIAAANTEGVPAERFTAMVRFDENRAKSQLAAKAGVPVAEVTNLAVWGNHSPTMVPDFENARIGGQAGHGGHHRPRVARGEFLTTVQQRGKAIIDARGPPRRRRPPARWSTTCATGQAGADGRGRLGVDGGAVRRLLRRARGLISGFPVTTDGAGTYEIVQGLELSAFAQGKLEATVAELEEERAAVADML